MKNQTLRSSSVRQTRDVARKMASFLRAGDVIGLTGPLGGGKTTFVQGLAEGLGLQRGVLVSSPTYTFIHEYRCDPLHLYHMDFYRLGSPAEAGSLGLDDYLDARQICIIEWFEKARQILPGDLLDVRFTTLSEMEREIEIVSHGPRSQTLLDGIAGIAL